MLARHRCLAVAANERLSREAQAYLTQEVSWHLAIGFGDRVDHDPFVVSVQPHPVLCLPHERFFVDQVHRFDLTLHDILHLAGFNVASQLEGGLEFFVTVLALLGAELMHISNKIYIRRYYAIKFFNLTGRKIQSHSGVSQDRVEASIIDV